MTRTGTNLLGLLKDLAYVEMGYFGRPVPEADPRLRDDVGINADMWATIRSRGLRSRPPGDDPRRVSAGELRSEPDVVVRNGAAVGEQLAVVVEQDDAVAQQSPALLGVTAHHGGEVTGLAGGVGAALRVVAHRCHIRSVRGTVPGITYRVCLITTTASVHAD
jgi:hypothetical protein